MILNILIIIIVLILSYLFLFRNKEKFNTIPDPQDFYQLHRFNLDSSNLSQLKKFTEIDENLENYPKNITEIVNQVKNKKIIEALEKRSTGKNDEANTYNIKVKLSKAKALRGQTKRINSRITIYSPDKFNLAKKLNLQPNDMINVFWKDKGVTNSINVTYIPNSDDFEERDNETTLQLKEDKLPSIPYSYKVDFIITKLKCNFTLEILKKDKPQTKLDALKLCAGDGKRKFTNTACTYDYCRDFIDNTSKEKDYDFSGEITQRTCDFDPSNNDTKLGLDNTVYKPNEAVSEKKLKCIQKCTENGNDFCTFKQCKKKCNDCTNEDNCPWIKEDVASKMCRFEPKGVKLLECIKDCQSNNNCDFDKCENLCRKCKNPDRCKWYKAPVCKFTPHGSMLSNCLDNCIDYGLKNTAEGAINPCSYKNCKASCESCVNPMKCSWIVPKVVESKCQFMPWGPNKQACVDRCVSNDKIKWGGKACTLSACTQACDSCNNIEQCKWLKEPEIDPNIVLDNEDRPPVQRIRALAGNNRIFIQWKQNINKQHPTIGYILQYFKTYRPIEGIVTRDMDFTSNELIHKNNLEFELTSLPKDDYSVAIIAVNSNGPGRTSNVINVKVPGTEMGNSDTDAFPKKLFK